MTTEEKILKALETLQADVTGLKQGQEKTHTILSQHKTALEALAEGQQDIREHMATKDGVDIAVEAVKIELKADIFASIAPMTRKVISNDRRVTALEEKTMPSRKLCKGRE